MKNIFLAFLLTFTSLIFSQNKIISGLISAENKVPRSKRKAAQAQATKKNEKERKQQRSERKEAKATEIREKEGYQLVICEPSL